MTQARTLRALCIFAATLFQAAVASNKYPIVLVHGLAGWGRSELGGFKYWGGLYGDYQEELRKQGYQVFTAEVGPFSSNWDRACEIYAQIKGGRVDYGANHSRIHGHERYGRTYPGLYPQWGTVVDGKIQKVHFVGHSMGGLTSRMLTQMLNHGTAGSASEEDPASHELFRGGKDWVHSITTISSPHQGTTLADGVTPGIDLIENAIAAIFGLAGASGGDSAQFYDAKLDQWGIKPKAAGESMSAYVHRIFASKLFAPGFKDFAGYGLATYGARAENKWVKTLPNVYYYSFVTHDTFGAKNILFRNIALPNPFSMLLPIQPTGTFIGSRFTVNQGFPESWLPNDGLVNVPSQISDGSGKVVDFGGRSVRGVWNRFKTLTFTDHGAIIGLKLFRNVLSVYSAHAALLKDLPGHEDLARRRLEANTDELEHAAPTAIVSAIEMAQEELIAHQRNQTIQNCLAKATDAETKQLCALFLQSLADAGGDGVAVGSDAIPSTRLRHVRA